MTARRRQTGKTAAWLIAAALILRAMVPFGWMPTEAAAGGLRIVLCSGSGPIELSPDGDRRFAALAVRAAMEQSSAGRPGSANPHGNGAPHDPCPFGAALGKACDIPVAIAAPQGRVAFERLPQAAPDLTQFVSRDSLPPPARGPPIAA